MLEVLVIADHHTSKSLQHIFGRYKAPSIVCGIVITGRLQDPSFQLGLSLVLLIGGITVSSISPCHHNRAQGTHTLFLTLNK